MLADRVHAQLELLRERLVDDRHLQAAGVIGDGEVSASDKRYAKHVEIIRPDDVVRSSVIGVRISLKSFHGKAASPVAVRHQRHGRRCHTAHAGNRRQVFLRSGEERRRPRRIVRALSRRDAERRRHLVNDCSGGTKFGAKHVQVRRFDRPELGIVNRNNLFDRHRRAR